MSTPNPIGYYIVYRDASRQWRWTFHAANHKKIAVCSESYINKSDCIATINMMAASNGCTIHTKE